MTHNIYFVKARTNKQKQTDVLLYVNDGCGLNNCYSIKCNKQQEKYLCFKGKYMYFTRRRQNWNRTGSDQIGPDWIRVGSQKVKKNQKHQIVYELVINKNYKWKTKVC